MSETLLLNLLWVPGLVVLGIGIWLFRSGTGIEKKISTDYTPRWTLWFINAWPAGTRPWPFGRFERAQYWEQHSTRPLAYVCTAVGVAMILLSLANIFSIPIEITQEQMIGVVLFFVSILFLDLLFTLVFGIMVRSLLIITVEAVFLLLCAYFIFRPLFL